MNRLDPTPRDVPVYKPSKTERILSVLFVAIVALFCLSVWVGIILGVLSCF